MSVSVRVYLIVFYVCVCLSVLCDIPQVILISDSLLFVSLVNSTRSVKIY